MIECRSCWFVYYYPRYEDIQMQKLYCGYRNPDYQIQRMKHEPNYTAELNDSIGKDPVEIKQRKKNFVKLLSSRINMGDIKTVLDFGGDKGQFIPDELYSAQRYVYDISGVDPLPGITRLEKPDGMHFDLIMCCHVLEHLPDPKAAIQRMTQLLAKNGLLYIELPYDGFFFFNPRSRIKRILKKLIIKFPFLLKLLATLTGKNLVEMHEHINNFNEKSLEYLVRSCSLSPVLINTKVIDLGWIKASIISCLAEKES
jgi:SAM-dependent methyltransferase